MRFNYVRNILQLVIITNFIDSCGGSFDCYSPDKLMNEEKLYHLLLLRVINNMWDRKLYDEMFYGVILFRCMPKPNERKKIEIDLWDKRVNEREAMNFRLIFLS
jgi:hypothetical protein